MICYWVALQERIPAPKLSYEKYLLYASKKLTTIIKDRFDLKFILND